MQWFEFASGSIINNLKETNKILGFINKEKFKSEISSIESLINDLNNNYLNELDFIKNYINNSTYNTIWEKMDIQDEAIEAYKNYYNKFLHAEERLTISKLKGLIAKVIDFNGKGYKTRAMQLIDMLPK